MTRTTVTNEHIDVTIDARGFLGDVSIRIIDNATNDVVWNQIHSQAGIDSRLARIAIRLSKSTSLRAVKGLCGR